MTTSSLEKYRPAIYFPERLDAVLKWEKGSLAIAGPVNLISRVPCEMRTNASLCLVQPRRGVGSAQLDKLSYNHI